MTWQELWGKVLGFPTGTPEFILAAAVLLMIFVLCVFPAAAFLSLVDRKLSADVQARVGPNRAGRWGVFQPLADLMKLLQKEPARAAGWREGFWLGVLTVCLYSTAAALPLGSSLILVNTGSSPLLVFWVITALSVCLMFLGYNQNSVPGWFSGTRLAAQSLSGAFPALLSVLCVGLWAGGFEWTRIAAAQGADPAHWAIVRDPFLLLAFAVFMAGGLVVLSVPPLGSGFSLSDIKGGVASGFHGRKIAFFHLGRFYGLFLWSVIAVVCFCGAWNLPTSLSQAVENSDYGILGVKMIEPLVTIVKAAFLMLFTMLFARVMPALRSDQVTDFAWKVLSPIALVALLGTGLWTLWGGA
ncbi:MAG TPA: complex I subunit 1 family protein [Bdellovibrionota bacterium]|jgi:NADH:ubiquinone oxidoreductase subunit H|nr:complex I subunit 1 family protein [Bdellovibrionota bacterium]